MHTHSIEQWRKTVNNSVSNVLFLCFIDDRKSHIVAQELNSERHSHLVRNIHYPFHYFLMLFRGIHRYHKEGILPLNYRYVSANSTRSALNTLFKTDSNVQLLSEISEVGMSLGFESCTGNGEEGHCFGLVR